MPASFKEVEPETPEPESEQSESEEEKAETDQLWQDPSSDNPVILSSDIKTSLTAGLVGEKPELFFSPTKTTIPWITTKQSS